uniref:Uncharacterized protein n=1 Tax=Panagrolaimus sp. ES5 TaxID=591445 RepID=A0AC34FPR7_9BILA
MIEIIKVLATKKDATCIALITGMDDRIVVCVVDAKTNEYIPEAYSTKSIAAQQFVKDIPKLFGSKLKAVILQAEHFKNVDYESTLEFRKALKEKFDSLSLPTFFNSGLEHHFSAVIIGSKINAKIGDQIVIIVPNEMGSCPKLRFLNVIVFTAVSDF